MNFYEFFEKRHRTEKKRARAFEKRHRTEKKLDGNVLADAWELDEASSADT